MLDGSFIKRCGMNVTLLCGSREGAYVRLGPNGFISAMR